MKRCTSEDTGAQGAGERGGGGWGGRRVKAMVRTKAGQTQQGPPTPQSSVPSSSTQRCQATKQLGAGQLASCNLAARLQNIERDLLSHVRVTLVRGMRHHLLAVPPGERGQCPCSANANGIQAVSCIDTACISVGKDTGAAYRMMQCRWSLLPLARCTIKNMYPDTTSRVSSSHSMMSRYVNMIGIKPGKCSP
jgi:hypothetical protein